MQSLEPAVTIPEAVYGFGPFAMDTARRRLTCAGAPVAIRPRTFALLAYLVRNAGRIVSKAELSGSLWQEDGVSEGCLSQHMWLLRGVLARDPESAAALITEPRRGYRFNAAVRIAGAGPRDRAVDRRYQLAEHHLERRTPDGYARARVHFSRAIDEAEAADRAAGYAGLAEVLVLEAKLLVRPPRHAFVAARAAAVKALALDPGCACAHAVLAEIAFYAERDRARAQRHCAAALAADPHHHRVRLYRGLRRAMTGDFSEALPDIDEVLRLRPLDVGGLTARADAQILRRDPDAAAADIALLRELHGPATAWRYRAAVVGVMRGAFAATLDELVDWPGLHDDPGALALAAYAARAAGLDAMAAELERSVVRLESHGRFVGAFDKALIAVGKRDCTAAAAALRAGAAQSDPSVVPALRHPLLDRLRGDLGLVCLATELQRET